MEDKEKEVHFGGIFNYFEGATINNLVINGNMTKSGTEQYQNNSSRRSTTNVTADALAQALEQCKPYIWGNAAYSVAFCVCRDEYHMENNTSNFERMLGDSGITLPAGTINASISRNPWMKYHIDKWEENGAMDRVLKLRDEFKRQLDILQKTT